MLVSFFKTPPHKRFTYRPLYAKDTDPVFGSQAAPVNPSAPIKSIRFNRRNSNLNRTNRYAGIQRMIWVMGVVWGLSWALFGEGNLRWMGLALPVLVFFRWRSRRKSAQPLT